MSTRSQYDPLDMALGLLAQPIHADIATQRHIPSTDTDTSASPNAAAARRRVSTNIRMNPVTLDCLRGAAIELAQSHSMGDLVDRLVADYLAAVVSSMLAESHPSRLIPGRRVRQPAEFPSSSSR